MINEVQYDIMPEQLIPAILADRDAIHEAANEAYTLPNAETEDLARHQSASNMAQEIAEGLDCILATICDDQAPYICLMMDYARQLQAFHLWSLRNVTHAAK
ncbi:MAG: hypothetical protein WCK77_24285 [Verrucomicrobiota bacterium]